MTNKKTTKTIKKLSRDLFMDCNTQTRVKPELKYSRKIKHKKLDYLDK